MTFVQNQGNQQLQQFQPQVKPAISQPTVQTAPQPVSQPIPQQAPQIAPQIVQQQQPVLSPGYTTNPQTQSTQSPNYAGVNIQIYNPSVGIPNINPTGNMTTSQAVPGIAYPSNYYTQQYGIPQNAANAPGGIVAQGGNGGNANVYNTIQAPESQTETSTKGQNSDNVKALTDNNTTNETTKAEEEKKKTEKRKVVELTDEYIKNLENYLNSQDKEVRMMGAKEVVERLQEDDSRKDDPALTALVNKMLQDPDQKIRLLALSMIEARTCTGNDYTIGVLKKMQNGTSGYGQDATQATSALLKMSGNVVEKEFEVKDKNSKK